MGLVTQQDPIGIAGGLNLYGYANGDPINFSDPFGLCPVCPFLGIAARVAGPRVAAWVGMRALPFLGAAGTAIASIARPGAEPGADDLVAGATRAGNSVYRSLNAAGDVQYVGITNNLARRSAEHLAERGLQIEELLGGLSRSDARSVEQALIEIHGLGRDGGTLLNRINSIAETNPIYAESLERGEELLRSIGYR